MGYIITSSVIISMIIIIKYMKYKTVKYLEDIDIDKIKLFPH